jgi:hypothetical protein
MTSPAYSVLPSGKHKLTKQTNYCLRRLLLHQLFDVFQGLALFSNCVDHAFEAVLAEGFHSFPQFLWPMAQNVPPFGNGRVLSECLPICCLLIRRRKVRVTDRIASPAHALSCSVDNEVRVTGEAPDVSTEHVSLCCAVRPMYANGAMAEHCSAGEILRVREDPVTGDLCQTMNRWYRRTTTFSQLPSYVLFLWLFWLRHKCVSACLV